jgi:hypothetical protein
MNVVMKSIMIVLIMLAAGQLAGQIKLQGRLRIPGAERNKTYEGVMTIRPTKILIQCRENIFQLLNEFNSPKSNKIAIDTGELYRIFSVRGEIILVPRDPYYFRFRNLLNWIWYRYWAPFDPTEWMGIVFIMDNPGDVGLIGWDLIGLINERNRHNRTVLVRRD